MSVRQQKNPLRKTWIKGITYLLFLLGFVACLAGIVSLIDADAWYNPVFWIGLAALQVGVGLKFWRPVVLEPVELLKREVTASQGSEESLLRASELPPSQQQTELLRAAQYGTETPAEELLRAAEESRQDV